MLLVVRLYKAPNFAKMSNNFKSGTWKINPYKKDQPLVKKKLMKALTMAKKKTMTSMVEKSSLSRKLLTCLQISRKQLIKVHSKQMKDR